MLKIRKGGTELLVPSSSYENYYESLGFEIVNEKSNTQTKTTTFPTTSTVVEHKEQVVDKKVIKNNKDNEDNVQNK